ncbi:unnamed protein product [Didymodactylos carnosus]|nr:unnamed protein product [Didymodactylos carnosus]CAF4513159.1 unnamed protein product [Didymodactylos carnosus]
MQWIAKNYESIDEYDDALIIYDRTLKMFEDQLHPPFDTILNILKKILNIYKEQKHDLHSVLKYKIIQHKYIVRDAYETPFEEYNINYIVDQRFELRLRQETIFKSHIELAHRFLDVNDYYMGNEHLSEALELADKNNFGNPCPKEAEFLKE